MKKLIFVTVCISFACVSFAQDTAPPSAPSPAGFSAVAVNSSWIKLDWAPFTDNVGVTGYYVYRNGQQIAFVTKVFYDDLGLAPRSSHTYTVRAVDGANNLSAEIAPQSAQTDYAKHGLFPFYDTFGLTNKPDLKPYGLSEIVILYGPNGDTQPDWTEAQARDLARSVPKGRYIILDIENHFTVQDIINHYGQQVDWMRDENPDIKIAIYDYLPLGDYWSPVSYMQERLNPAKIAAYEQWKTNNAALRVLADKVDAVFPSLYTFYDDRDGWKFFAREQLAEAFKYGKPVYPFIWPEFHGGGQYSGHPDIPSDYWRMEMDFLKAYGADGLVGWGGNWHTWDPNAAWFGQTKDFIAGLQAETLPSRLFSVNQRVETKQSASVYAGYWETNASGSQSAANRGWVQAGPVSYGGNIWWYVNYDRGADGWTTESLLQSSSFQGLLASWQYEEASGKALDSTKHNYTAMSVDNPARTAGKQGSSAVSFNGMTQYLNAGIQPEFNFGAGSFTLATWAKLNTGSDEHNTFISLGLPGSCCDPKGYPGYCLGERYNQIVFRLEDDEIDGSSTSGDPVEASVPSAPYKGAWHHFAGVRDGDSVKLYIDGVLKASASLAEHYTSAFKPDVEEALIVGANRYWGLVTYFGLYGFLDGAIDDTRIYNIALSQGEIQALMSAIEDTTPPGAPASVKDGATAGTDMSFTYSTTTLSANWAASTDNESGITNYQFSIGTRPAGTDVASWTALGNVLTVTKTGLSLSVGTTYYFSVKAENGVGLQSASTNSNGQLVLSQDSQGPVVSNVSAQGETGSGATITWETDEPSTSRVEYGLTAGYGSLTGEYISMDTAHSVMLSGLAPETQYHFRVISRDYAGNESVSADYAFTTLSTLNTQPSSSAYPNPCDFSNGQVVKFVVRSSEFVEIRIYTLSGKLVRRLTSQSGANEITWDGTNEDGEKAKRGVYIYTLTNGSGDKITGKLAIMR